MNSLVLQDISLKCAERCLETIGAAAINKEKERLIKQLAACAARCIACSQGCAIGTCLPETVLKCRQACEACLQVLETEPTEELRQDVLDSCQNALRDCIDACHA